MSISIIIPTLDEEETIESTLRLTTSLGFDEIIVVDGGSTDRTCTLVAPFASASRPSALGPVLLISSPPGRSRQLNAGAKAAKGDVLLFLHADTHLPSSAKPSIEAAVADGITVGGRFDVKFDSASPWGVVISSLMNLRSRLTGIATGDQGLFVRRMVFEELGGFADIPLMEDIEFSVRLKRRGRIAALRERVTTSFRRWERGGPVRTILLMWTLRGLYWFGVSPNRLSRFYSHVRSVKRRA
ncbi:MAG TPA: TIGR04283 family arsenosugar biosynthesis glycosyltransferase [Nitrospira sp.]|nr:TIGR04283 family arsenosugar biosynthesis glycosyltransferase [Nitrospira sp.]